jgi:hypothetical protein
MDFRIANAVSPLRALCEEVKKILSKGTIDYMVVISDEDEMAFASNDNRDGQIAYLTRVLEKLEASSRKAIKAKAQRRRAGEAVLSGVLELFAASDESLAASATTTKGMWRELICREIGRRSRLKKLERHAALMEKEMLATRRALSILTADQLAQVRRLTHDLLNQGDRK